MCEQICTQNILEANTGRASNQQKDRRRSVRQKKKCVSAPLVRVGLTCASAVSVMLLQCCSLSSHRPHSQGSHDKPLSPTWGGGGRRAHESVKGGRRQKDTRVGGEGEAEGHASPGGWGVEGVSPTYMVAACQCAWAQHWPAACVPHGLPLIEAAAQ